MDELVQLPRMESPIQSRPLRPFSWYLLASSAAVLLVAWGYARGRDGSPGAAPLYWVGVSAFVGVGALFICRRRELSEGIGISFVVFVAIATYLIKVCYDPQHFLFTDEFLQYVTARNIVSSHHLFSSNPYLPVSPYYPGLELITANLSAISKLSIEQSSMVILGAVHLVTTVGIYLVVLEIVPNRQAAALGTLIYSTTPDYLFFDSYFAYQSLGLMFFVVALLAVTKLVKSRSRDTRILWMVGTIFFGFAIIVTHHLSSYLLLGTAVIVAVAQLWRHRDRQLRWTTAAALGVTAVAAVIWDTAVAHPTFGYVTKTLRQQIEGVTSGISILGGVEIPKGLLSTNAVSNSNPKYETVLIGLWCIIVLVALGLAFRLIVRERSVENWPLRMAYGVVSVAVVGGVVVSGIDPNGGQLSARVLAFAMVPGCAIIAVAWDAYTGSSRRSYRHSRMVGMSSSRASIVIAFVCLAAGGIAQAWPPHYALVPGPYVLGGRMRAITEPSRELAGWAATHLHDRSLIATDEANALLLASLGNQHVTFGPISAEAFVSTALSPSQLEVLQRDDIQIFAVDSRIGSSVPVNGQAIFPDDPFVRHYAKPIPQESLQKFGTVPDGSLIYSNGVITLYDIEGDPAGKVQP